MIHIDNIVLKAVQECAAFSIYNVYKNKPNKVQQRFGNVLEE